MDPKHDQMFLEILKEEKNVTNFLDAFFGFLYRCTDFYVESGPNEKLGFIPGVAEKLVFNTFHKWKSRMISSPSSYQEAPSKVTTSQSTLPDKPEVPPAIHEVEITDESQNSECVAPIQPSECYNGAIRDNYTWSQTIADLDVLVNVPPCITSAKDVQVNITADNITIAVNSNVLRNNRVSIENISQGENVKVMSEWTTIFNGQLSFRTRKNESIWSLVPGRHISIHLEKTSDRWWEALLVDEPKIKLDKIDCSRDLEDLGATEQMKVQELMWNHQQKMLGKPTSEQIRMEKILKQAWDAEGSPFKGTPYDPSVLKLD